MQFKGIGEKVDTPIREIGALLTRLEKKERNSCHVHIVKFSLSVSFVYLQKPIFLDNPTTLQPFKTLVIHSTYVS